MRFDPRRLLSGTIDARMHRYPRSLSLYLASAALYAFLSYLAVQIVYDWELDRAGLHTKGFHPETAFRNTFTVHLISFAVWLAIALFTGALVHRVQRTLATALAGAQERAEHEARVNEDLQRLNKAKGDFVSVVAHEFRTPLTGIQGFSEIIRDYDLTLAEAREYAADIHTDALRLTRMINTHLDLDRLQSGRLELLAEPVQLNEVVTTVVDLSRPATAGHRLLLNLDPALPTLTGDRDRLVQVVTNLLDNAIKYSPDGGDIRLRTQRENGHIHLSVADQGLGIPSPALDRIFEPYTRIDTRPSDRVSGTGLGLPIVRQIVALHGGRIWVESDLGRGSIFHVALPLVET